MSDARMRRVQKEIKDCAKDKVSQVSLEMVESNPFHLIGAFPGPPDTPYEGGYYEVDIVVPESYPFQPVKMKFITKVYRTAIGFGDYRSSLSSLDPNISSASGAICLDILKDAWSPVLTLKSTLISLQSLLCDPVPNDPQDAEGKLALSLILAKVYLNDRAAFERTARHWAQAYAQAPAGKGIARPAQPGRMPTDADLAGLAEENVKQFEDMGFDRPKVISVLKRLNYRGNNVNNIAPETVLEELFK